MGGTQSFCHMFPQTCMSRAMGATKTYNQLHGYRGRAMSATKSYQQMHGYEPSRMAMSATRTYNQLYGYRARARSYIGAGPPPGIEEFKNAIQTLVRNFIDSPTKDVGAFVTAIKTRVQEFLNQLFAWIGSNTPAVP